MYEKYDKVFHSHLGSHKRAGGKVDLLTVEFLKKYFAFAKERSVLTLVSPVVRLGRVLC